MIGDDFPVCQLWIFRASTRSRPSSVGGRPPGDILSANRHLCKVGIINITIVVFKDRPYLDIMYIEDSEKFQKLQGKEYRESGRF